MSSLLARGLLLCLVGLPAVARAHAQTTSDTGVAAHLAEGYAALEANRTDDAARAFQSVLVADPQNVQANANLGVLAFLRGDCAGAEPPLRKALSADPGLAKAQGVAGICAKRAGEADAETLLASAFLHLDEPKLRAEVGVELADLYYQRGDMDRVLPVIHGLVALNPENVDILFFAQRVYAELADETLNKLAVLAPDSARMQEVIAERLVNGGNLAGAIEHYRKALAIDPRLPGMHFELAEAIMESAPSDAKAQAEAATELQSALQVDGDTPRVECALGSLALKRGDAAQSGEHYARAHSLNPREPEALMGLAHLATQTGKPAEAEGYLRSAIEVDPFNAQAHYQLALTLRALHKPEQMEAEMKLFRQIKQTKEHVTALYRQMNPQPQGGEPVKTKP